MLEVSISDLPDEILKYILMQVSPYRDLKSCMAVCRDWYRLVAETVRELFLQFTQDLCEGPLIWETRSSGSCYPFINERFAHSACVLGGYMYVFGGWTNTVAAFNDLWKLDLATRTWCRPLALGTYPGPKGCASMVSYKSSLILFGGCQPLTYSLAGNQRCNLFREVHVYDTDSNMWTEICSPGPPGTAEHTATVHGCHMVVFGGTLIPQPGLLPHSTNDLWCFNLETHHWFTPSVDPSSQLPHSRYRHSQIKLDDNHLLILGGCGGANMIMSDMWLLTIPEDPEWQVWSWSKLSVNDGPQCTKELRWHKACKIGDHVVLLNSKGMAQSMRPGWRLAHHSNSYPSYVIVPPSAQILSKHCRKEQSPEPCVNGRRGTLRRRKAKISSSSSDDSDAGASAASSRSGGPSHGGAAPLVRNTLHPSIRPNSLKNRERQLEGLKRMEDKLRCLRQSRSAAAESTAYYRFEDDYKYCLACKKYNKPVRCPMSVSVLDVSKAVTQGVVRWLPERTPCCGGPEETLLYSLVLGRGEAVLFGGMQKEKCINELSPYAGTASNSVHFLKLPVQVP